MMNKMFNSLTEFAVYGIIFCGVTTPTVLMFQAMAHYVRAADRRNLVVKTNVTILGLWAALTLGLLFLIIVGASSEMFGSYVDPAERETGKWLMVLCLMYGSIGSSLIYCSRRMNY